MSITSVVNDTVTSVSVLNAQKPLPPTITNYSVGGVDDTALDPAGGQTVQINGTGFLAGATITFDGSAVAVVTYVNSNQLTFTSPAKSAGTYTIYVVNPDGGTAIYIPGIIYSVLPTWTTGAGTLGSYYETQSISNTVVASGDAPITYSLYSGSLPTGSTLAANGVITGTAPVDSSSTTYSFTIQATDAQLQDSTRSFSLTINTDVVTWVSPANATTYTSAVDSAIANVTLSATDAAGYAVTYSANALPTGLTLTGANIAGTPTVIADSSTLLTATAATTNRTATRTINWSITVANDIYFEYNTLLIPGASTTFVDDASTNNFAITINGDTKPNSFNPYTPGYYSNYFDGTGDYLSVADNIVFQMSTGDFTVEAWVNPSALSSSDARIWSYQGAGGTVLNLYILASGSGSAFAAAIRSHGATGYTQTNGTTAAKVGTWYHVAFTRSSGTTKLFVNGIQEGSTQTSQTQNIQDATPSIGGYSTGNNEYLTGYISNLRIVKGTAVYTSNFTPNTTPLTAISGTSLLTCQSNRFIDNSTNAFTVTAGGNTTVNSFDPFTPNTSYSTYGSAYFDGTGDYLITPSSDAFSLGTGDFTYEAWIYPINNPIWGQIVGPAYNANGLVLFCHNRALVAYTSGVVLTWTIIQMNAWQHVAVTRQSGTVFLYHNGVKYGTSASLPGSLTNTPFYIGANSSGSETFTGYITDVRIVKGTAVYTTTFTPPSQPLTAISGTSLLTLQNNQSVNNSVFLDNSTNNFLVTRNGNATQGTFSPYGGNWSNYFDGTGDYLTIAHNSNLSWTGNTDGSMEAWIYLTSSSATGAILSKSDISGSSYPNYTMAIVTGGYLNGYVGRSGFPGTGLGGVTSATAIPLNTWAHVLFTRKYVGGSEQNQYRIFVNGVLRGFTTNESPADSRAADCVIGGTSGGVAPFSGYISNVRFFNNSIPVAYQTSSQTVGTTIFTPSTTPLVTVTGTQLLTCQSNRLIDNSINNFTITKNGDTSVQRFSPFNPSSVTPTSYSGYFDGNGDYLNTPSNAVFGFGTGDFTIEAWFYFTGTISTYQRPWWFGDDNDNIEINGSVLRVGGASQGTLITGGTTIVANTWYHIALTRASGSYKLWLNGSQQGSTASNSYNSSARTFTAMATSSGVQPSTGYISNLRIVKGTAVYTTTFTPSTTPLTAISGTSLLTLQSTTFIDNSTNNLTLTAAGNSKPTIQNPFGYTSTTTNGYSVSTIGGSGYFDGSGDYLSYTGSLSLTGAFTVQGWFYNTSTSGAQQTLFVFNSASGNGYGSLRADCDQANTQFNFSVNMSTNGSSWATTLSTNNAYIKNVWNHFAVTRDSSNAVKVFINGVQIASGTQAGTLYNTSTTNAIGCNNLPGTATNPFNGYISDLQLINGTALYNSNFVPPSAPLTAVQNTSLLTNMTSAGIYDAAMMNNMESVGDAKLSTAISKFGGSSMSFDGTGDYLVLSGNLSSGINAMGTGDFTIEFWLYANSVAASDQGLIDMRPASTNGYYPYLYMNNGQVTYWLNSTAVINSSAGAITTGTWYHVALSRSGSSNKLFINGTQSGSTFTSNTALLCDNNRPAIGSAGTTLGASPLNGYLDDLRITKGYARYTSNFTPPTTPFPVY